MDGARADGPREHHQQLRRFLYPLWQDGEVTGDVHNTTTSTPPPPPASPSSTSPGRARSHSSGSIRDETTSALPTLLPLGPKAGPAWAAADYQAQSLLAALLRTAVVPWYSRLTPDRRFVGDIVATIRHLLLRAKVCMLAPATTQAGSGSNGQAAWAQQSTPLELLLVEEIPLLLMRHLEELRRSESVVRSASDTTTDDREAARIFVNSTTCTAVTIDDAGTAHISGAHVDALLHTALLVSLPLPHAESPLEMLILSDIVKGLVRGQLRVRGDGPWAVVQWLLAVLEVPDSPTETATASPSPRAFQHDTPSAFKAVSTLAIMTFKTFFAYLCVTYLEIFTPKPALRKATARKDDTTEAGRGRKRKGQTSIEEKPAASFTSPGREDAALDFGPLLTFLFALLQGPPSLGGRLTINVIETWAQIVLVWGGNRVLEQSLHDFVSTQILRADVVERRMKEWLCLFLESQQAGMVAPTKEVPSKVQQEAEFQHLVDVVTMRARRVGDMASTGSGHGSWSARTCTAIVALLLGSVDGDRGGGGGDNINAHAIVEAALAPFLAPTKRTRAANACTLIALLERLAVLFNPALEAVPPYSSA